MTGTASGLTITGKVYSEDPVFDANPVPNNIQGGSCDGFSATDPTSHQPYTSMTIGIKNNMATAQTINVSLTDLASGTTPTSYKLKASITVPAGATIEETLRWGIEGSRCQADAGSCLEFEPSCTLGAGTTFDPTHLLSLGLGLGKSPSDYPINDVNVVITSISFD